VETRRHLSLAALGVASNQGQRPRDLDAHLIADAAAQPDSSRLSLIGQGFHYNWLLENQRLDEAEEALQRLNENTPSGNELWMWQLEFVWFYARFRQDLTKAKEWMERANRESTQREGNSYWKASAAMAFLEDRLDDSEVQARQARAACEPMTNLGLQLGMFEEIDALLNDVAAMRAGSGKP
jgi:hypothetical protein